jgi:hypothetical protein
MDAHMTSLGQAEVLDERPFTHPSWLDHDHTILETILERLRAEVPALMEMSELPRPLVMFRHEADGRTVRIVIGDLVELTADRPITVVGFFGSKREGIDYAPLDAVDDELIAGLPNYPGVLSYCSQQQPGGNWANLVLLRDPKDMDHWSTSPRHAFVAKAMAPEFYLHIRLHNGGLEGGILSRERIVLHRTKYYDFAEMLPWRAIRDIRRN